MTSNVRTLLLVRHGLPDYRVRARQDEVPGPPLSEIGHEQARQAAAVVAEYAPDAIYSSPLMRTMQTAAWLGRSLRQPVRVATELKEWQHCEDMARVNFRCAGWLRRWLQGGERCAAAVSHGSPLLSVLRTALYLPHVTFWKSHPAGQLVADTADRFEVTMASVFEIRFEPQRVIARCVFHARPRIMAVYHRRVLTHIERGADHGEGLQVPRPNFQRLIGYRAELPAPVGESAAVDISVGSGRSSPPG